MDMCSQFSRSFLVDPSLTSLKLPGFGMQPFGRTSLLVKRTKTRSEYQSFVQIEYIIDTPQILGHYPGLFIGA